MNGRTANTGLNNARKSRAFKLSATTSAVRAALAVSATMLALAGSGVAYAGNCSVSALNTVSCNGVFTDTIIGFVPTDDLTLVVGDTAPTSVTPGFGDDGIVAIWDNVTVISYADITTEAADGIYAASDYTVSVTNHGNITTDATLDSTANAIDAIAFGDVTVVNDGSILAYSNYGDQNVTAVSAVSLYGITSVDNQEGGDILASAYSGDAYGVAAFGKYGATVSNEGSIAASSFGGDATGVTAAVEVRRCNRDQCRSHRSLFAGWQYHGRVRVLEVRQRDHRQFRRDPDRLGLWRHDRCLCQCRLWHRQRDQLGQHRGVFDFWRRGRRPSHHRLRYRRNHQFRDRNHPGDQQLLRHRRLRQRW